MGEQKTPWWKRTWIWVVVGIVLVVGVVGNLLGLGGSDDEPPAAAPSMTVSAPAPAETEAEPPTEESAESRDDGARGREFDQSLRENLGVTEYSELLAADPSLWGGYVADIRVDGANAYVTLQVGASDTTRDDLGERAARAISTLLPASAVEGIDWIIVEDATGVVISQEQPAPVM